MEKQLIKKIVQNYNLTGSLNEKTIKLFELVREIPYGSIGSRDPKDVFEKKRGTCSGKHALLKELFEDLGIEVKVYASIL